LAGPAFSLVGLSRQPKPPGGEWFKERGKDERYCKEKELLSGLAILWACQSFKASILIEQDGSWNSGITGKIMKRFALAFVITGILTLVATIPFAAAEFLVIKYFKDPESICFENLRGEIIMEYVPEDQEFVPFKEIFFHYSHKVSSLKILGDEEVEVSFHYFRGRHIQIRSFDSYESVTVYPVNIVFAELKFIWKELVSR